MIKALERRVKWREVSSPEVSVSTGGSLFDSETNLAIGNQLLLLRNSELGYRNLGSNVLAHSFISSGNKNFGLEPFLKREVAGCGDAL